MRNGTIGWFWRVLGTLAVVGALLLPTGAGAVLIDFDDVGLAHGSVIDTQYLLSHGVEISATNVGGGPDLAVAFDSAAANTRDPDLEFAAGAYDNILIVQENGIGCGDRVCDLPDDEGSRPAGFVEFSFDQGVIEFGLDLLDVEGAEEMGSLAFFQGDATVPFAVVDFQSFSDSGSSFYDALVSFGDNSANHLKPILASELGVSSFDRVRVIFGGSGGLDNVRYQLTPEPGTAVLLGLGLAGLALRGRAPSRRRRDPRAPAVR